MTYNDTNFNELDNTPAVLSNEVDFNLDIDDGRITINYYQGGLLSIRHSINGTELNNKKGFFKTK